VLGEVDHQQDDVPLGPCLERTRFEDVLLERLAVRAPIAAGEHRQDRPAGPFGVGHRGFVARVPGMGGHFGGGIGCACLSQVGDRHHATLHAVHAAIAYP
jgi:hypothetical protein